MNVSSKNATRLSDRDFRVLIEQAPALVFGADEQGRVVLFNAACEALTGYRCEELLGRPFLETLVPEAWQPVVAACFAFDREAMAEAHVSPWRTRSGDERFIEWRCSPLDSAEGRLLLGLGRDVTEARRQEALEAERLADEGHAREQAEQANRLKDDFITMLSHELRTPLNAIVGWVSLLKTGRLPQDRIARALDAIERSARLQIDLVHDLLDINRMARGTLRLEIVPIDLSDVVHAAVETVRPMADARGVPIDVRLEPDPIPCTGDAARLQQVLINLLTNGVKFVDEGGRIHIDLERDGAGYRLQVSDNGPGIDPGMLPHLFEPFRQQESRSARRQGLGLGLAIARRIVELHGGTLDAHSPGRLGGATFVVTLPIASPRT
jgi:PAS domain S-box-containing protein